MSSLLAIRIATKKGSGCFGNLSMGREHYQQFILCTLVVLDQGLFIFQEPTNVMGGVWGFQCRVCDVMGDDRAGMGEIIAEGTQKDYRTHQISCNVTHSECA